MDDQGARIAQARKNELYKEMLEYLEWLDNSGEISESSTVTNIIKKSKQLYD